MLTSKDIDLQYYLYSQPTSDIVTQLHNCEHCQNLDQCDSHLENNSMNNDIGLSFCQNNATIMKIRQQQESLYVKN